MTAPSVRELHHEVCGPASAPAVLFLHGLGSSSADWAMQVPAFADRYHVLTLDLRGHGRSRAGPSGRFTVDTLARDVADTLRRLREGPVHAVGLSLGGCVALALALGHPELVRSLVLVNAFARLRPAGARGAARMLQRLGLVCVAPMSVVAAHVARGLFPKPEQREAYLAAVASLGANPRRTYLASLRAVAGFDARARLRTVKCPTLVVAGDRDRTVPRAAAALLGRSIPGARVVWVPDSGHATPYDQPEAFNRIVMEFLATI